MDAGDIQKLINEGVDPDCLSTIETAAGKTTLRQRWRRTMFFQHVDSIPNFEFGYWVETFSEWHKQGLPTEIDNEQKAYDYFGIENWHGVPIDVMCLRPSIEIDEDETKRKGFTWYGQPVNVIEETKEYFIYRDEAGCIAKINKQGNRSIPQFLDFYLKDRKSWEQYKQRLQPSADRIPKNWSELVEKYNKRDYPLTVGIGSMIGLPRNWIGFENIALMVYDEPDLLEEIVETLCCLVCDMLEMILPDVEFDFGSGWEDICFNSGPIVGYDFMRNVVTPRYKRITNLLKKHGCFVSLTDCDGDILPILDCFIDGGINCMFPVETHAGTDPLLLRQKYPDILMQGGMDKMRLTGSKIDLRKELNRLLPVVRQGGFIPSVDHRVPCDVPLENYKYYLKLKRDMFGVGGTPQYNEKKIG